MRTKDCPRIYGVPRAPSPTCKGRECTVPWSATQVGLPDDAAAFADACRVSADNVRVGLTAARGVLYGTTAAEPCRTNAAPDVSGGRQAGAR